MTTKLERATSLPSTPKSAAIARPSAAAVPASTPVEKSPAPNAVFAAESRKTELPTGERFFAKSAEPGALWGSAPAPRDEFDVAAFSKLPPAARGEQVKQLRAERDALHAQIRARLGKLDHMWKGSRVSTRAEALREYEERSRALDPGTRQKLDGMLERAERAQRRINQLRAQTEGVGGPRGSAERKRLADELTKARADQEKAVKQATTLVDDKGLKNDRLMQTEQIIDPNAPQPGSGDTLLEQVTKFFHLEFILNAILQIFTTESERRKEKMDEERKHDVEVQRKTEDLNARIQLEQRRLEDDAAWAEQLRRITSTQV